MAINKNALFRYQILDRCFSNKYKVYTLEDLFNIVNDKLNEVYATTIEIRQLHYDIADMKNLLTNGVTIVNGKNEDNKTTYRYSDQNFSIFNNMLDKGDLRKLRSAINTLSKYRGLPSSEWIEEVISNLEYRSGIKANKENIIAFEQNERLKGLEFLSKLIQATESHQPLLIHYKTYKGIEFKTIVHPYHLKQYNNRWFLFGLEEIENETRITNKALDRIIKVQDVEKDFIPNNKIDFSTFFDDVVGVSIPYGEQEKIKLRLQYDEARFPYIVSKPIHKSQKVIDESNRIIEIEVVPNKELDALILQYGPQVEVLAPEEYRDHIAQRIKELFSLYNK